MSGISLFRIFTLTKCTTGRNPTVLCQSSLLNQIQARGYAKKATKGKGKGMLKQELVGPEVCKDPVRLTTYAVGVNIYKQGEDPKLKPPEEYPEWLFNPKLRTPKKLHELEPDTWEYWKCLRKENIWRSNRLHKGKKF
ncbi:large ribosomal subunit protein mL54 isoform X2 [Sphaeramia orbicularis]|uniref:large ribosomal subunit protein mL54 isoform X2 n=1 Tax=Sphaeramia orbicularis TaxID=375764 RepID=UPI00118129AF|nr:39S ribosomal protein L54, mitochondrial isoform X2 [Sphaeramia orbicularis]